MFRVIAFGEFTNYYVIQNKKTGHYEWFRKDNFINEIDGGISGDIIQMDNDRIVMLIEPYLLWHPAETFKENRLPEEVNKALKLLEQISKMEKKEIQF